MVGRRELRQRTAQEAKWSLRKSLLALGAGVAATGVVSETLTVGVEVAPKSGAQVAAILIRPWPSCHGR